MKRLLPVVFSFAAAVVGLTAATQDPVPTITFVKAAAPKNTNKIEFEVVVDWKGQTPVRVDVHFIPVKGGFGQRFDDKAPKKPTTIKHEGKNAAGPLPAGDYVCMVLATYDNGKKTVADAKRLDVTGAAAGVVFPNLGTIAPEQDADIPKLKVTATYTPPTGTNLAAKDFKLVVIPAGKFADTVITPLRPPTDTVRYGAMNPQADFGPGRYGAYAVADVYQLMLRRGVLFSVYGEATVKK